MDGNIFRPQDGTEMPAPFHDLSEFGLLASAPSRSIRWSGHSIPWRANG